MAQSEVPGAGLDGIRKCGLYLDGAWGQPQPFTGENNLGFCKNCGRPFKDETPFCSGLWRAPLTEIFRATPQGKAVYIGYAPKTGCISQTVRRDGVIDASLGA